MDFVLHLRNFFTTNEVNGIFYNFRNEDRNKELFYFYFLKLNVGN